MSIVDGHQGPSFARGSTIDERVAQEVSARLESGASLIIKAWPSPALCTLLQDHLERVASRGENVVVLDNYSGGEGGEFGEVGRLFLRKVFIDDQDFTRGNGLTCASWWMNRVLQQSDKSQWLQRLRVVVVPAGEQAFGNPFEWELLAKRLQDRFGSNAPQFIVVIAERRAPESALRSILPILSSDAHEISFRGHRPDHVWWTIWTSQSARAYAADQTTYCGIEPVLAQFAGAWGIQNSHVLAHPALAFVDQRQNLQKDDQISIAYQEDRDGGWLDSGVDGGHVGAVAVRDSSGNPWRGLRGALEAGNRDILVHLVTQHTILTHYQLANGGYFARKPLDPLSPTVLAQNRIGTVAQLLLRIEHNEHFRLDTLRDELTAAQLLDRPAMAFRRFKEELSVVAGKRVAEAITLCPCREWRQEGSDGGFERTIYVRLTRPHTWTKELDWLRVFSVREETNADVILAELRAEHVWQAYMPGQVCVIDGKSYHVQSVNWDQGRVYVSHLDTLRDPVYRETRKVRLLTPHAEWKHIDGHTPAVNFGGGLQLEANLVQANFEIRSLGFTESDDHWASPPRDRPHLANVRPRSYVEGRFARISLCRDGTSLLSAGAAVALAQWLNEAAVTLLPETHRYLVAVAAVGSSDYPTTQPASWIIPTLDGESGPLDHSILIFEDSQSDVGIPRAILNHLDYLLELCGDYLAWLLDENSAVMRIGAAVALENAVLPAADFLAYGASRRDPAIDLEALRQVLQTQLPTTKANAITERRRRALAEDEDHRLVDEAAGDPDQHCDFCGDKIADGQPEIFADGRVRCTSCCACGIDRLAQLRPLYDLAKDFLESLSPGGVPQNIDVKLVGASELANVSEGRFIPTSGFDARAVGIAVRRSHSGSVLGEDRHTVMIESGFSPEVTTSTLVHELTHTWQYNMLDFDSLRKEHGRLLIEGHAVWAEVEFARRQTASPTIPDCVPERLQRLREQLERTTASDSEYGRGYRLLVELTSGFGWVSTPFIWLLRKYPARR